jgi:hypothetical protein
MREELLVRVQWNESPNKDGMGVLSTQQDRTCLVFSTGETNLNSLRKWKERLEEAISR